MRSLKIFAGFIGAMLLGACTSVHAQSPVVDGRFDDWQGVPPIATDPLGDASNDGDVTFLRAQSAGTMLFLQFDINTVQNLQSGQSQDQIPRVEIGFGEGQVLTLDLRGRTYYLGGDPANWVSWETIDFISGPTFADDRYEIQVDLGPLGVATGDGVTINFTGSDSLDEAASFVLADPPMNPTLGSTARDPGTDFRVASINTLRSGLIDPGQADALKRLIDAVDAEIYCFQEEYDSSAAQVTAALLDADPLEDGAVWNVHKVNDNVVASRSELVPLPSYNSKYAAAVVELEPGRGVVVFSIHPKCCGFVGSSEDDQRIGETEDMIRTLSELRSGLLGPGFAEHEDAPVVVIGDWNLVGSRTPLTMLEAEAPAGAGLRDWLLYHLDGTDATTWRGSRTTPTSFSPGRLDLVAFDDARLLARNGFILDTSRLPPDRLSSLGLQAGDSDASDHLMLVADFEFAEPNACIGDTNGDTRVDYADLGYTIFRLGESGAPGSLDGDANGDGVVNTADLSFVLARLGSVCL